MVMKYYNSKDYFYFPLFAMHGVFLLVVKDSFLLLFLESVLLLVNGNLIDTLGHTERYGVFFGGSDKCHQDHP